MSASKLVKKVFSGKPAKKDWAPISMMAKFVRERDLVSMSPPSTGLAKRWKKIKKRCSFSSSDKLVRSKSFTEQVNITAMIVIILILILILLIFSGH